MHEQTRQSAESAAQTWRRKNPAANINIVFLLKTDTNVFFVPCDVDLFDLKINGLPGLMVDNVYVKFGDPSCITALKYHVKNKQTDA